MNGGRTQVPSGRRTQMNQCGRTHMTGGRTQITGERSQMNGGRTQMSGGQRNQTGGDRKTILTVMSEARIRLAFVFRQRYVTERRTDASEAASTRRNAILTLEGGLNVLAGDRIVPV